MIMIVIHFEITLPSTTCTISSRHLIFIIDISVSFNALPETNIFEPENGWLEDWFPFGMASWQVLC